MWLFSGIKNTYKKSEAASIVQTLLKPHEDEGLLSLDSEILANKLIAFVWVLKPDIFNGKFGQRPHKMIVAAFALANGIDLVAQDKQNQRVLAFALSTILSEVETNERLYPFNSLDYQLLETSMTIFLEFSKEMDESPLGNEINTLMDIASEHNIDATDIPESVKKEAANAFSLAETKVSQLDYAAAKTYYQQAVQLDPDNALYLNGFGFLLVTLGEYAAAESLYKRSLAILEKVYGKDHTDVAASLNNLAMLYTKQSKYAAAEPLYNRSLAIREKSLGKEHHAVAESLNNLAGIYDSQGNTAKAEPLYQRALTIKEKTLGENHPDVASSLINLAGIYNTQGKISKAESLYQRSLAILEKTYGKNHPNIALNLSNLAFLYYGQGKIDQAKPLLQRSLDIYENVLGKEHPSTKNVRVGLEMLQAAKKTSSI